jgi:hypothetical protein
MGRVPWAVNGVDGLTALVKAPGSIFVSEPGEHLGDSAPSKITFAATQNAG